MKRLLPLLLLLFIAASCDSEGQNVHNGDNSDSQQPADTTYLGDAAGEDVPGEDPGPPFNNQLAWKLLDPGAVEVWNTLTGFTYDDGAYEVYVAGGFGAVAWFDSRDKKWRHANLPETLSVNSLWTDGADYIVVAGEDGLLKRRYDFAQNGSLDWYNDDLSTGVDTELDAVHGYDRENIWAVGQNGVMIQFGDDTWTVHDPVDAGLPTSPAPDLSAVLAMGPQKALITMEGALITYDAGAFTKDETTFAGYKLRAIYDSGNAVWIAADKGTVFKSVDGGWEKHQANVYSQFKALWQAPSGVLFAAGTQTDPTVWTFDGNDKDNWDYVPVESPKFIKDSFPELRIDPASRITGIWGTSDENAFVCTKEKQVVHFAIHP
jgi:hypothetical protein